MTSRARLKTAALAGLLIASAAPASAQAPGARPRRVQDTLTSPVIGADGRITFQLYAPKATEVLVRSEGPAPFANQPLTKGDSGVWRLTAQVPADLYIYWFDVDGVAVADPRNNRPRVNMSTVRSLLEVPGTASEFFAERPVPHGEVAAVHYQSKALGVPRRMHVYTPPGYATSGQRYPVLYLLHGAGDNDQSWLMAGRANFIIDNLIAAGKAKPMIVVMPAGHTPNAPGGAPATDAFARDLLSDVVPYVERNFRTLPGREQRAIAGLSMGGQQTLNVGLGQPRPIQPARCVQLRLVRPRRRRHLRASERVGAGRSEDQRPHPPLLVRHGQGRLRVAEHEGGPGVAGPAQDPLQLQGERGRPHVAQLASVSHRVRSAALPVGVRMLARWFLIIGTMALAACFSRARQPARADSPRRPVVRLAELEIDPAQLERYLAFLREEIETSIRVEPGVLTLYAVRLKTDPTRVRLFEMYADSSAYQAHIASPHFRKYKVGTEAMVKSLVLHETDPFLLGTKRDEILDAYVIVK